MSLHVKICGLSEETTLRAAIDAGADMVGFVHFPKSPRHVSLARAAELKKIVPVHVASVVVTVHPDDALIENIISTLAPTYLQLHGNESAARVADIRSRFPQQKLIHAIPVSSAADLGQTVHYESLVDMLMFDAKPPAGTTLPGGNGVAFDWNLLKGFETYLPWLLSGGLTPENVAEAIAQSGAKFVDVSSGVERAAGVKDADKIRAFIKAAKA